MNENLSLESDFTFVDEAGRVNTQVGTFYAATYGDNKVPVTLLLSPPAAQHQLRNTAATVPGAQGSPAAQQAHNDQQQSEPRSAFSLCPVTKFIDDSIPSRLISNAGTTGTHIHTFILHSNTNILSVDFRDGRFLLIYYPRLKGWPCVC